MHPHDDTDPGRGGRQGRGARIALMATLVAATIAACSTGGPGASASPSSRPNAGGLVGRTFLSTGVTDGGAPFALVEGTQIRLTFQERDLGASAGCNIIGGQYRVDDGKLVFEGTSMTEMACPDGRDAQDQWLIGILTGRPTITLSGNSLTIEAGTITIALLDQEVAEPDQPLVGPRWMLTGIITGDAVASVPAGVEAWLEFSADGGLALQSGCNGGGGRWTMDGDRLEVSDPVMELRLCEGAAGQVESAVLGVLGAGPLTVEIDSNSMTLSAVGLGLQLQAPGPD